MPDTFYAYGVVVLLLTPMIFLVIAKLISNGIEKREFKKTSIKTEKTD